LFARSNVILFSLQTVAHLESLAADVDNTNATFVHISGLVGSAACGNGLYKPQPSDIFCSRVRYKKEHRFGNASTLQTDTPTIASSVAADDWWLEHYGGRWQLKQSRHKGTGWRWANTLGGTALEACGSHVWRVSHIDEAATRAADLSACKELKLAVGDNALAKVTVIPARTHSTFSIKTIYAHQSNDISLVATRVMNNSAINGVTHCAGCC
jgi:hypothetical protein